MSLALYTVARSTQDTPITTPRQTAYEQAVDRH